MRRQKIQRELMKLEQENLDKREEIIIKKDEAPAKIRASAAAPKASRNVSSEMISFFCSFFLGLLCIILLLPHLMNASDFGILFVVLRCSGIAGAVEHKGFAQKVERIPETQRWKQRPRHREKREEGSCVVPCLRVDQV